MSTPPVAPATPTAAAVASPAAPLTAELLAAARQAREAATQAATAAQSAHNAARRRPGADTASTQAALDQARAAKQAAEDAYAQLHNRDLQGMLHADDWALVANQIERSCRAGGRASAFVDDVVQPCGRVANRNCAGVSPPAHQRLPQSVFDELNAANKSQIDFAFLQEWEGGLATTGYVPWWPQRGPMRVDRGAIVLSTERIKGHRSDASGRLHGGNQSGVTIGVGVDLGQQRPDVYKKRLEAAGASKELIDKLMPYVGLKHGEACAYLRAHPLNLTEEEATLLSKEMKQDKYEVARNQYNQVTKAKFNDLSPAEQTVLYSRTYQDGNLTTRGSSNKALATALGQGDRVGFRQLLQDRAMRLPNQCASPDFNPSPAQTRDPRILKEFRYVARQPLPPAPAPPGP